MLEKLSILRDDPLFRAPDEFDPGKDTFNHEAYARAIFKVLHENKPPLSIGLFGPWGIGKSTVINILFKLIKDTGNGDLRGVYFNAWKYSGDSFRRQFLIEVAKEIYSDDPGREAKLRRLEQLNYADVLKETQRQGIGEELKSFFTTKIRLRTPGMARVVLAILVLAIGAILTAVDRSVYPLLASFFPTILVFLASFKFEDLFLIQENPVYDPKFIFPEQFEAEFRKLVDARGPLGGAKAVVVIDDIDRCEPSTVRDILVSIKTFLGNEDCFFVVPCDDKSIVQVFQDPNQRQGYQQELLRKYFNVGIRMAPLMGTDLVDFANSVSRQTGIPQGIVQMAILANCRDARKMKHFLNNLAVKYGIAKAREQSGFMPVDIDKNLPGFAKAVLIEDLYPGLFARLVEHPDIYDHLANAALGVGPIEDLNKLNLQNWEQDYPGLKEILQRTRDIKIENIEVFLSLKTTNPEARIPKGFELKNAIVQGDNEAVQEIAKQVVTDVAKSSLAELLINLLDTTSDTFLTHTVSAALTFYCGGGQLPELQKPDIARSIAHAILYKDGQRASSYPARCELQCVRDAGGSYLDELLNRYEAELGGLDQPPANLADTVDALYAFTGSRDTFASVLNKKFDVWANDEKGLTVILQLQLPASLKNTEKIPSYAVLEKIAAAISTDSSDSAVNLNQLRNQVLFKNWDARLGPLLAERLLPILQQAQSDTGYTKRAAFVVNALLGNAGCLEPKFAPQLWPHIQNLYNRVSDPQPKRDVHKPVLTFAAKCPVSNTQQAARDFGLQNWQRFDSDELRSALEFLSTLEDPVRTDLQRALIRQEFSDAQSEMEKPTDRTIKRLELCLENKELLGSGAIQNFLLKSLESQDAAFATWRKFISDRAAALGQPFVQQLADRCLSLVASSYNQSRREAFIELFATVLGPVEHRRNPA